MFEIKIPEDTKLYFSGLVLAPTGKEEGPAEALIAQYKLKDKDAMLVFNGRGENPDELSAKKEITYKEFMETYKEPRVYLSGYKEL